MWKQTVFLYFNLFYPMSCKDESSFFFWCSLENDGTRSITSAIDPSEAIRYALCFHLIRSVSIQFTSPKTVEATTSGMAMVQMIFWEVFMPCARNEMVPPNIHMEIKQMAVGIKEDESKPVMSWIGRRTNELRVEASMTNESQYPQDS